MPRPLLAAPQPYFKGLARWRVVREGWPSSLRVQAIYVLCPVPQFGGVSRCDTWWSWPTECKQVWERARQRMTSSAQAPPWTRVTPPEWTSARFGGVGGGRSCTMPVVRLKLASCEHNRIECICSYVHLPPGSADAGRLLEVFSFAVARSLSFD